MFCYKCGAQMPDNGFCPSCGTASSMPNNTQGQPQNNQANFYQAPNNSVDTNEKKGINVSKGSKTFAALVTAGLVFPASLSIAIDLTFHRFDFWFGYVVGALLVAWVCLVLPGLKILPAPVTAIVCFITMMGYAFYLMYKFGAVEWLFQKALPLTILFIVFVSLDVMLLSAKKVNWLTFFSLASFETGIYLVAIEATHRGGLTELLWSPILACGFISVAAVLFAFAYIGKVHKK